MGNAYEEEKNYDLARGNEKGMGEEVLGSIGGSSSLWWEF
jgi:hypothetical protein